MRSAGPRARRRHLGLPRGRGRGSRLAGLDHRRVTEEQRGWLRQLPPRSASTSTVDPCSSSTAHRCKQNEYLWADRPSRVFARVASDEGDDLMCFGNTHEAFHRLVGKTHFVAAGSVGCGTAGDPSASYAVIDMAGSGHDGQLPIGPV